MKNSRKHLPSSRKAASIVAALRAEARVFRNPHTNDLLVVAAEFGKTVEKRIPGARVIVGGSLRSRTAIGDHNDIDLRVLMPANQSSEDQLAAASQKLTAILPFKHKLEKPPYLPLGFHHQKNISRPAIGEVAVEATVQPAKGYFGLAAKSARLPSYLRYRYIVLKADAMRLGNRESYNSVKKRWAALIHWLNDRGFFKKSTTAKPRLLNKASREFPEFFSVYG